MSVNKYDSTTGKLITLAGGTRMWIGTQSAHDLAVQNGTMPNNCMVCITDDYTSGVGSISLKQVRIEASDLTMASTTYGGLTVGQIENFYSYADIPSTSTIINVLVCNNSGASVIPIQTRDSSASNKKPYTDVAFASSESSVFNATSGYITVKVFYIEYDLGTGA